MDNVAELATQPCDRAAVAAQQRQYQREWARDAACLRTVAKFSNNQLPARSSSGFAFLTQNFSRGRGSLALVRRGLGFESVEGMMGINVVTKRLDATRKNCAHDFA